ncbi:MAG: hypothetical protein RBT24_07370 [Arcobacteraceae bacterium]|jgi:hypothetical protein|nr:hypothetical protein [Arcobacteraceae bacterium]
MESILNEDDMIVGATFENGTIQDYVDENKTYGLIRIEDSTCNWFLYNKEESANDIQALYRKVTSQPNHFVENDFGEEIVLFNKTGSVEFEEFLQKVNEYLDDEFSSFI